MGQDQHMGRALIAMETGISLPRIMPVLYIASTRSCGTKECDCAAKTRACSLFVPCCNGWNTFCILIHQLAVCHIMLPFFVAHSKGRACSLCLCNRASLFIKQRHSPSQSVAFSHGCCQPSSISDMFRDWLHLQLQDCGMDWHQMPCHHDKQ